MNNQQSPKEEARLEAVQIGKLIQVINQHGLSTVINSIKNKMRGATGPDDNTQRMLYFAGILGVYSTGSDVQNWVWTETN